jgi:hypothetical protein
MPMVSRKHNGVCGRVCLRLILAANFAFFLHIPHTYLIFNKQLFTHIFVLFFWYFKINLIAFQIKGAYAPGTKNTTPTPL